MKYTVRIEGKPEPVEVDADCSRKAAEAAAKMYDFDEHWALSEGNGSNMTVLVSGGMLGVSAFRVSCMTEPVYRARGLELHDPRALALMAETAATPPADVPEVTA